MHEAVRAFYQQHYSANLMRLVVVGRQPLDELETLVRSNFSAVPSTQLSALQPPGKPPESITVAKTLAIGPDPDPCPDRPYTNQLSPGCSYECHSYRHTAHSCGPETPF